jgi:diguanylate cyclase (GGDEF)-like protein/PAS domain S-box-containing protein
MNGRIEVLAVPALLSCTLIVLLIVFLVHRLQREIARRKQAESATVRERGRLNAILNNSGVGVLLVDRNARYVDVNRRWCRMFGYHRQEARDTLSVRNIVHPGEAASIEDHFRAMLGGKVKSHSQECRFVRKDGSVFWGLISTSAVQEEKGRRKWAVGMITDIDGQKRVEAALRESEERLRFITENTHDVVWQLDGDLRFTYVNGADERMRGYPREEVIGRNLREIVTPAGQLVVDQVMRHRREQRETAPDGSDSHDNHVESFEVEMRCKGGNRVWAEIYATVIRDTAGRIVGYVGVARDATQRREKHAQLREQTIRDPLTGLFNRRYLDESLRRELLRAKRDGQPLSLLMIDIDHFKRLNDTHGHQAGDEVLKRLGELIRRGARRADLPCRYGGEEFLLVLPDMSAEDAAGCAEEWRMAFANERIDFDGRIVLSATFSAGVATCPANGNSCEGLIRAADQALYAAKNSGRNRVVVSSSS